MALKCIRAGIPILAAVSAPTSMALELAQELNLTTVGFVRDQRLNIYTAPERVAEVQLTLGAASALGAPCAATGGTPCLTTIRKGRPAGPPCLFLLITGN